MGTTPLALHNPEHAMPRRLHVSQCIPGTLSRQLAVYRQRVAAAPALLECETLSRTNV